MAAHTIDTDTARHIAAQWYSPQARGMVELATCTRHPLSDAGVLALIRDTEREIDEAAGMKFTTMQDLDDLNALLTWAEAEADHRGLR